MEHSGCLFLCRLHRAGTQTVWWCSNLWLREVTSTPLNAEVFFKKGHFYTHCPSAPDIALLLPLCRAAAADDIVLFKGDEYLWCANPHLEAFFKAYLQQEPVLAWCKATRPDLVH